MDIKCLTLFIVTAVLPEPGPAITSIEPYV